MRLNYRQYVMGYFSGIHLNSISHANDLFQISMNEFVGRTFDTL